MVSVTAYKTTAANLVRIELEQMFEKNMIDDINHCVGTIKSIVGKLNLKVKKTIEGTTDHTDINGNGYQSHSCFIFFDDKSKVIHYRVGNNTKISFCLRNNEFRSITN